jgi:hypothetical protein
LLLFHLCTKGRRCHAAAHALAEQQEQSYFTDLVRAVTHILTARLPDSFLLTQLRDFALLQLARMSYFIVRPTLYSG